MGGLIALSWAAPAGELPRVWQPEIDRIEATEGGPIFNNGTTRITITGRHLLPVVLEKDGSGKEVKLGLTVETFHGGGVVSFIGRVGGVEVSRQYALKIGTGWIDWDHSEGRIWNDTVIRGNIVRGIAPGVHQVGIWEYPSGKGPINAERPIRVITSDVDDDGHDALAAGGDDCNDGDRTQYPGAIEVPDFVMHDEDCNPETLGSADHDGDGHLDSRVCNWRSSSSLHCGDDCDDGRGSVHPYTTEACNDLDDDCDGIIDEELYSCSSPHAGQTVTYEQPQMRNRPTPAIRGSGRVAQTVPPICDCKCPQVQKQKK
jgi:hypothetical protein